MARLKPSDLFLHHKDISVAYILSRSFLQLQIPFYEPTDWGKVNMPPESPYWRYDGKHKRRSYRLLGLTPFWKGMVFESPVQVTPMAVIA